jgi:hypothetical protein
MNRRAWGIHLCLFVFVLTLFCTESFGAKDNRGVKALFGTYKREKFTENEARYSDIGTEILLSTMYPLGSLVRARDGASAFADMQSSLFFNGEINVFFTLNYSWQFLITGGYYSFETRQQFSVPFGSQNIAAFRFYNFETIPILAGVKYRMGTGDIVPYVGVSGGINLYTSKYSFDYSTQTIVKRGMAPTIQAAFGVDFYVTPRIGLKVELAGYMMLIPADSNTIVVSPNTHDFTTSANPISVRYASGIFILF